MAAMNGLRRLFAKPDQTNPKNPYFILVIVCAAMFLDLMNLSAVTIALPTIQKDLNVNVGSLQWIISAYALTFGGFMLLGGRSGDTFGHRYVLLFGMTFFALFTLVCALVNSFIGLVIARAFQGIGAAATIPSAQAHIALLLSNPSPESEGFRVLGRIRIFGIHSRSHSWGVLTDLLGWRWIFWISLILSGAVILAAFFILPYPESRAAAPLDANDVESDSGLPAVSKKLMQSIKERLIRFDALGVSLGIPGILMLTYALTSANTVGWGSVQIIITLVLSICLLALFVFHERSASQAILAPHLFRSASFNMTLILAVNTYAVRQACTYFLTIQLQSFGNSPIHTSVLFIPLGVSALMANNIAGRLIPIFGGRAMFILGWALSIPGVLLFSFIDADTSYWRYTFPAMILYIAGIGIVYITANFVVVSSASKSDQGAAAGVFNVAIQVGGSTVGLAVLTAVAQGIEDKFGDKNLPAGRFSHVAYQSVYFSCLILCFFGLLISVFAIKLPEGMAGNFWKKEIAPEVETGTPHIPSPPSGVNDIEL